MMRRGNYQHMLTGEVVWLLYELDGQVNFQHRSTGAVERLAVVLFTTLYQWHSEVR